MIDIAQIHRPKYVLFFFFFLSLVPAQVALAFDWQGAIEEGCARPAYMVGEMELATVNGYTRQQVIHHSAGNLRTIGVRSTPLRLD